MPPKLSYLICTAPRTGSTLLTDALFDTGVAGRPREYFDENFDQLWVDRLGITSDADYFDKVLKEGSTPNGVFGLKTFWFQLEYLVAKLARARGVDRPDFGLLDDLLPGLRYIFLMRRDKVRQAISYLKADQTQIWWNIPGAPGTRTTPESEPSFDFAEIDRRVNFLTELDASWRHYFESRNVVPLTLFYEDFAEALEPVVHSSLEYLGIPIPEGLVVRKPRMLKQSDEVSESWVRQYHELKQAQSTG